MGENNEELRELLDSVELTAPWLEKIKKECPYCGKTMKWTPGDLTPNVATCKCECGFGGVVSPPEELRDKAWEMNEIIVEY